MIEHIADAAAQKAERPFRQDTGTYHITQPKLAYSKGLVERPGQCPLWVISGQQNFLGKTALFANFAWPASHHQTITPLHPNPTGDLRPLQFKLGTTRQRLGRSWHPGPDAPLGSTPAEREHPLA